MTLLLFDSSFPITKTISSATNMPPAYTNRISFEVRDPYAPPEGWNMEIGHNSLFFEMVISVKKGLWPSGEASEFCDSEYSHFFPRSFNSTAWKFLFTEKSLLKMFIFIFEADLLGRKT